MTETRRRAHVLLTEEDLFHLLGLKDDEQVVAVWPEFMRNGVVIGIQGATLPECEPGVESSRVERPYAMVNLRQRLIDILMANPTFGEVDQSARYAAIGRAVEEHIFGPLGVTVPYVGPRDEV